VVSFFLSFYLFSSPNLSGRTLDVYHTSTHAWCGLSANLECRSVTCCTRLAGNAGRKNCQKIAIWAPSHNLSGYVLAIKARIDNRKNSLNSNIFPTCPYNMANFSLLSAEICWWVWGTPANFNSFRVWTALLHGSLVVGVSQTLRCWTEGATYIRQGGYHVGHWPTFLVSNLLLSAQYSHW